MTQAIKELEYCIEREKDLIDYDKSIIPYFTFKEKAKYKKRILDSKAKIKCYELAIEILRRESK